jgi:hypothetical protein
MAHRIFLPAVSQNGKNGVAGHSAKSYVCIDTVDSYVSQLIQWIQVLYYTHSNRESELYGAIAICLSIRREWVKMGSRQNDVSSRAQSPRTPKIEVHMGQREVLERI